MERVQAAAAIRPGIGAPIPRVADLRLLTGRAAFTIDRDGAGHAHAAFVRSPHAHARLAGIDSREALRMPGVIAVFTAADLAGDGAGSLPAAPMLRQRDGQPMAAASWHLLASDRVRHVGDPVAMVVADSVPHAQDAAEAVRAGYEPLAAVVDARAAVAPGAPQVWHTASGNVAAWYECGDRAAVDAAFARAARVARVAVFNQRLAGVPLEPRAAICDFDPRARAWTLQCTSQHSHLVRNHIAESVLRVPREKLRVTVGDLGGGFGTKAAVYPEYALVAWAAGRLERTVRWEASRSESFVSDVQGRDLYTEAELALDGEGRFLALRVDSIANAGAYLSWLGPIIPTLAASRVIPGPYRTAAVHAVVRVVLTHTVPVEAYRGAGRPEYAYLMERLVEAAARSTGIDAIELRRRNLVARAQMPFRNALGDVYDSGDFPRVMQAALDASDGAGFAARRLEARARGCRLG
ncbi:MAG: xanthine dehydrogenase family protein molybdopterin-binding subunit, partial [Burkholderiales bacterium]|nr:xanthine dehydrogenase family protein molybdopterin-binding subunit [Burkholderiales bacterium]